MDIVTIISQLLWIHFNGNKVKKNCELKCLEKRKVDPIEENRQMQCEAASVSRFRCEHFNPQTIVIEVWHIESLSNLKIANINQAATSRRLM